MITRISALLVLSVALAHGQRLRGPDRAPTEGAPIPAVSAKTPDGKTTVALAEPKRLTVLIFGSHT